MIESITINPIQPPYEKLINKKSTSNLNQQMLENTFDIQTKPKVTEQKNVTKKDVIEDTLINKPELTFEIIVSNKSLLILNPEEKENMRRDFITQKPIKHQQMVDSILNNKMQLTHEKMMQKNTNADIFENHNLASKIIKKIIEVKPKFTKIKKGINSQIITDEIKLSQEKMMQKKIHLISNTKVIKKKTNRTKKFINQNNAFIDPRQPKNDQSMSKNSSLITFEENKLKSESIQKMSNGKMKVIKQTKITKTHLFHEKLVLIHTQKLIIPVKMISKLSNNSKHISDRKKGIKQKINPPLINRDQLIREKIKKKKLIKKNQKIRWNILTRMFYFLLTMIFILSNVRLVQAQEEPYLANVYRVKSPFTIEEHSLEFETGDVFYVTGKPINSDKTEYSITRLDSGPKKDYNINNWQAVQNILRDQVDKITEQFAVSWGKGNGKKEALIAIKSFKTGGPFSNWKKDKETRVPINVFSINSDGKSMIVDQEVTHTIKRHQYSYFIYIKTYKEWKEFNIEDIKKNDSSKIKNEKDDFIKKFAPIIAKYHFNQDGDEKEVEKYLNGLEKYDERIKLQDLQNYKIKTSDDLLELKTELENFLKKCDDAESFGPFNVIQEIRIRIKQEYIEKIDNLLQRECKKYTEDFFAKYEKSEELEQEQKQVVEKLKNFENYVNYLSYCKDINEKFNTRIEDLKKKPKNEELQSNRELQGFGIPNVPIIIVILFIILIIVYAKYCSAEISSEDNNIFDDTSDDKTKTNSKDNESTKMSENNSPASDSEMTSNADKSKKTIQETETTSMSKSENQEEEEDDDTNKDSDENESSSHSVSQQVTEEESDSSGQESKKKKAESESVSENQEQVTDSTSQQVTEDQSDSSENKTRRRKSGKKQKKSSFHEEESIDSDHNQNDEEETSSPKKHSRKKKRRKKYKNVRLNDRFRSNNSLLIGQTKILGTKNIPLSKNMETSDRLRSIKSLVYNMIGSYDSYFSKTKKTNIRLGYGIGHEIKMKNHGETEWNQGIITSVNPLRIRYEDGYFGYKWDVIGAIP